MRVPTDEENECIVMQTALEKHLFDACQFCHVICAKHQFNFSSVVQALVYKIDD